MSKSLTITDAIKSGSSDAIVLESIIQNDVARTYTSDRQIPDLGEVMSRISGYSGAYMPKSAGASNPFTGDVYYGNNSIVGLNQIGDTSFYVALDIGNRTLFDANGKKNIAFTDRSAGVRIYKTDTIYGNFDLTSLTVVRNIKFQDKAYTGVADLTDITALSSVYQALSAKGSANGYAGLDSSGYVPLSQINPSLIGAVEYQGTWNASTNTPTLATGTGTKGYYYVVSVAGATTIDGVSSWAIGDWLVYDGVRWDKINNVQGITTITGVNSNGFTWSIANPSTAPALTLTLQAASGSQDGRLIAADWTTFNNKQNALGFTPFANPMTAVGDTIIGGASGVATRLPAGTNGYVYTMVSGSPAWAAAAGGSLPTTPTLPATAGTITLPFDGYRDYAIAVQTGDIVFQATNLVEGGSCVVTLDMNNSNTVGFPPAWINGNLNNPVNNLRNRIYLQNSNGEIIRNIVTSVIPLTGPSTLLSAVVQNYTPNTLTLTYNRTLDNTLVPATTDYTSSPSKTVSAVAVTGSTVVITFSTNFAQGDVITLTGGNSHVRDIYGNLATNLSAQAVTNNIGVAVMSDNFNRADSNSTMGNTVVPGGAWVPETGTWGIISNQAYCVSALNTGGTVFNRVYFDCGIANYTYQTDVTIGSSSDVIDITFRYVDAANNVNVDIDVAASKIKLYQKVAGGITTLSQPTQAWTVGTTYTIKTVAQGSTIQVYVNGTLMITTTCTQFLTSTKVALTVLSGTGLSSNAVRFDNLTVV